MIIILQLRERKVRPLGLIIMHVFMSFIAISLVYNELSSVLNIAIILAGILVVLLMGILIVKFMEVKIDEKDGSMILKGSYIAVAIWIAVILIKIYGENILGSTGYWIKPFIVFIYCNYCKHDNFTPYIHLLEVFIP